MPIRPSIETWAAAKKLLTLDRETQWTVRNLRLSQIFGPQKHSICAFAPTEAQEGQFLGHTHRVDSGSGLNPSPSNSTSLYV